MVHIRADLSLADVLVGDTAKTGGQSWCHQSWCQAAWLVLSGRENPRDCFCHGKRMVLFCSCAMLRSTVACTDGTVLVDFTAFTPLSVAVCSVSSATTGDCPSPAGAASFRSPQHSATAACAAPVVLCSCLGHAWGKRLRAAPWCITDHD